ncbi:hypothetical protein BTA51_26620 [Hahella sp. CCB-MM4]|uniref:hypothetical protein n=1 Tax=Hahella sp. (strain CCB-MM4) TaxID=1926491 RepID=UPI000B9AA41B|nr:hypothetical protein [Hahella sp. CCB-MM4]OZG70298.1 hypothetical protein BTA51_26620 [Hahella sp. CCB-MM4]
MNMMQTLHNVRLKAPFFAKDRHSALLRYLDPDFVNRFRQDIQQRRFSQATFGDWIEEEKHSRHDTKPVLRLPSHRAFHLVCCEVVCERFGLPALDPARITSAGFVIRRRQNGIEQAWMLEEGEALGWQSAAAELRDPDLDRRLCRNGVLHARNDKPAYSGEEIHPLHVLNSRDSDGKRHTLLFGYLPLGGFYYERQAESAIDTQSMNEAKDYMARSLPWPFGYREGKNQSWRTIHNTPVQTGVPSKAMFELLRLWVTRYHLGKTDVAENAVLEAIADHLDFIDESKIPAILRRAGYGPVQAQQYKAYRKYSLLHYLKSCYQKGGDNPLVAWVIRQEEKLAVNPSASLDALPNSSGSGTLNLSLKMVASDAQEIRHALNQRFTTQTLAKTKEIPLPKFGQEKEDVFEVIPFVRSLNDAGKEQIQWADPEARSFQFRVAAPFDPEASRPSLIQMPSLRDLKRGLAKGASILTPGDTFDMINGLNTKEGVGPDLVKNNSNSGLGIQWICSFSLPVITLVAMILLMIMIVLLNIVFFWLPWVRICLPFPKIGK